MPVQLDETKIRERITMLLRKAEATEFPDEAETASAQAEKLMIKLGIDRAAAMAEAFAQDGKVVDEAIIQRRREFEGTLSLLNARFLGAIVLAFGCKTVEHHLPGMASKWRAVTVVGHESTVEHAFVVWQSLRVQADTALAYFVKHDERIAEWKRQAKAYPYDVHYYNGLIRKARKNFLLNFAYGAARRIRDNRRVAEGEVKGTGTELMIIDRSKAVEKYYAETFTKLGKTRDVDTNGYGSHAGYRAGQAASTGERQFAGRLALEGR